MRCPDFFTLYVLSVLYKKVRNLEDLLCIMRALTLIRYLCATEIRLIKSQSTRVLSFIIFPLDYQHNAVVN